MSLCLNIKLNTNDDYLQLDDLYVEILYTILHMIGCEVKQEEQVELIIHLKNSFWMRPVSMAFALLQSRSPVGYDWLSNVR